MLVKSLSTLVIAYFIPAIMFLLSASYIFNTGQHSKKHRFISYAIALLSSILFIEFIRHFATETLSAIIHTAISNTILITLFCMLAHLSFLLIRGHSRFSMTGAPIVFYLPALLYVVLIYTLLNNVKTMDSAAILETAQTFSIALTACTIFSLLFTMYLLFKGTKYAPSYSRKRFYITLIISIFITSAIIISFTFLASYPNFYVEPALIGAIIFCLILMLSVRNVTFLPSLKRNYKMIVDLSPISIAVLDADFNILEVNKKAHQLFKFAVGTPLQYYFEGEDNEKAIIHCLQQLQQKKSIHDYQLTYKRRATSDPRHLAIDAIVVYVEHSHNYYFTIRDVTKEREQELLNYHLAYHDPLTDLHNRAYFVSNVELYLQGIDPTHRSALVLIDINFFKQINDTYGHQIGDLVLIHIAQVLKKYAVSANIIARLGGDEFVLYFNMLQSMQAFEQEMVKIRAAFKQELFTHGELSFEIVPSFGHAMYPTDAKDFEGLYHIADARMYEDKRIIKEKYNA